MLGWLSAEADCASFSKRRLAVASSVTSAQAQIHHALDTHPLITLHVYAEQDHAFARVGGAHFDAQAAELAHLRTLEFFVRHLGGPAATSAPQRLSDLWDEHVKCEFATRNTEDTLATMLEDAY